MDREEEPTVQAATRRQFLTQALLAMAGMRQPCHFKLWGDEMLVPDLDSVLTILDKDNNVVVQMGDGCPSALRDAPRSSFLPGKFIHPHAACRGCRKPRQRNVLRIKKGSQAPQSSSEGRYPCRGFLHPRLFLRHGHRFTRPVG